MIPTHPYDYPHAAGWLIDADLARRISLLLAMVSGVELFILRADGWALLLVPLGIWGIGVMASRSLTTRAWACIPTAQQDHSIRPMPLSWALPNDGLVALCRVISGILMLHGPGHDPNGYTKATVYGALVSILVISGCAVVYQIGSRQWYRAARSIPLVLATLILAITCYKMLPDGGQNLRPYVEQGRYLVTASSIFGFMLRLAFRMIVKRDIQGNPT